MQRHDYFHKHMNSDDPFVRDLYRELDHRIAKLEQGSEDAYVERMNFSDLKVPTVVTVLIVLYLIYSIVSHL